MNGYRYLKKALLELNKRFMFEYCIPDFEAVRFVATDNSFPTEVYTPDNLKYVRVIYDESHSYFLKLLQTQLHALLGSHNPERCTCVYYQWRTINFRPVKILVILEGTASYHRIGVYRMGEYRTPNPPLMLFYFKNNNTNKEKIVYNVEKQLADVT